jgi:murein DD-endopeptidase MepM/ murein hydrolase activator NlpD
MLRRTFLAALPLAAQTPGLTIAPAAPFPGSPVLFKLPSGPTTATWLDRPLAFSADGLALAAVGLEVKPGPLKLTLASGETHTVPIARHQYRSGIITVPPQFVTPPPQVQKRIKEEAAVKKEVFATRSPRRWKGPFAAPADTPQTSPFGTRRTYNGKTRSIHQGLDFRAAIGTPITATHAGKVLLAREMYYEGGFVVLDHGEGLFSLYMHLSKFEVKEGDTVEQRQPLALSGGSGRVTGPHLHFGVQWQGLYMEPATLLRLRFPV